MLNEIIMVTLENLQALRGYAVVYGLKGAYRQIDEVISGTICCDLKTALDYECQAREEGITAFQVYVNKHEGKQRVLQLIAFHALRTIFADQDKVMTGSEIYNQIKLISELL